jgi:hypothetical protein
MAYWFIQIYHYVSSFKPNTGKTSNLLPLYNIVSDSGAFIRLFRDIDIINTDMLSWKYIALSFAGMLAVLFFDARKVNAQDITWKLNNLNLIGNTKPEVLGKPVVINDNGHESLAFNGMNDGLVVTNVPIEGWKQFTIEVLFKPDGDGPAAPRFIHIQDKDGSRVTFELRLNENKQWFLDTFLKNGRAG